jgi:hypothetical protein
MWIFDSYWRRLPIQPFPESVMDIPSGILLVRGDPV